MKNVFIAIIILVNSIVFGNNLQLLEFDGPIHEIKAISETLSEESIKVYKENSVSIDDFLSILITVIIGFLAIIVAFILIQKREMKKKNEMIKLIDRKNKQIQNIIDSVPSMLSIKDKNGKFLFANENNARFLGLKADGLKSRYLNEFNHIDKR